MFGAERRWGDLFPRATGIYLVAGLLAVGGIITVAEEYVGEDILTVLFYTFMDIALPVIVLGVGVYLSRTSLSRGDITVATLWFIGGIAVLWTLYTWASLPELLAGDSLVSMRSQFVLYGNLGGAVGIVAGINRARARQNERLVERTSAQQDTLEFINHLLRHNVLNGLQVINGYADMLEGHVDEEGQQLLARIDERGEHMTELVDNVRVLMRTLSEELNLRPTDVSSVLGSELAVAQSAYPDATFEADLEADVLVIANQTLGAVFENLLVNAIKHNDADEKHVRVTLTTGEETATVCIADNGPGIPESHRQTYLQQGEQGASSTGEGLGLYLVSTLVDQFGGSVVTEDNEPRGTVLVVELPLADASSAANARR
ncbi:sensor histidine kinase [Halorarius litoreus]|uniref:sensor histidine kinase n=1 Tax=Halorarius litoreus TaxID=2962676 RepID=UPI0020CC6F29|nr:HAMP domain-containing sensor histidine kinase [Halorarius litoreus]